MDKIKIVVKKENENNVEIMEIRNELKLYQDIIGGDIETIPCSINNKKYLMILDEEGKLKNRSPNIFMIKNKKVNDYIAGTFIILNAGIEDFESLTEKEAAEIKQYLQKNKILYY